MVEGNEEGEGDEDEDDDEDEDEKRERDQSSGAKLIEGSVWSNLNFNFANFGHPFV